MAKCKFCGREIEWKMDRRRWTPMEKDTRLRHQCPDGTELPQPVNFGNGANIVITGLTPYPHNSDNRQGWSANFWPCLNGETFLRAISPAGTRFEGRFKSDAAAQAWLDSHIKTGAPYYAAELPPDSDSREISLAAETAGLNRI